MQDNQPHNIISPYTGQPPVQNKNQKLKFYIIGAVALVAILALIIASVISLSNGEETHLADVRENTPTLQLFAKLDREIPMGEIESIVHSLNPSAEVTKEDDGTGSIRIPDSEDYILFDYYLDEEGELSSADEDFIRLVDVASGIRYVYPITDDASNLITYSDDDQAYLVFVQNGGFEFATKQEAINNYLNPEAQK